MATTDYAPGSGEHPNGRRAMDDVQRRLQSDGVPAKRAEQIARQTALREDRKRNGK